MTAITISYQHRQIARDRLKRGLVDLALRRGTRLQTPMVQLLATLRAQDLLPAELVGLELFGMHGMWHTRDYAPLCRYLEFYEIDPVYAAFAARTLAQATVVTADSVATVRAGRLRRKAYNFIVLDNPSESPYGPGYVEHFDLFPELTPYIGDGVLVVNFLLAANGFSAAHAARRRAFYGAERPSVDDAVTAYREHLSQGGIRTPRVIYTARNAGNGYLSFVCRR